MKLYQVIVGKTVVAAGVSKSAAYRIRDTQRKQGKVAIVVAW